MSDEHQVVVGRGGVAEGEGVVVADTRVDCGLVDRGDGDRGGRGLFRGLVRVAVAVLAVTGCASLRVVAVAQYDSLSRRKVVEGREETCELYVSGGITSARDSHGVVGDCAYDDPVVEVIVSISIVGGVVRISASS